MNDKMNEFFEEKKKKRTEEKEFRELFLKEFKDKRYYLSHCAQRDLVKAIIYLEFCDSCDSKEDNHFKESLELLKDSADYLQRSREVQDEPTI